MFGLGIDESNHGKFPEVFVGAYSSRKNDLVKNSFQKNHRVRGLPYVHIIFSEVDKDIVGPLNVPLIAICEMASYVNEVHPLETIVFDGSLGFLQKESIGDFLAQINPQINFKVTPKADISYRLVNEADARAYHLAKYYTPKPKSEKPKNAMPVTRTLKEKPLLKLDYAKTLLTPRIEDYLPFLVS